MWTTRFAPSPTGALHLGHAWSAVHAHALARGNGGNFLLRIEDIDGTRSRPEHVQGILDDLEWLGLDRDGPVTFQSHRLAHYDAALDRLEAAGLVYPCFCTRAEIAREVAASLSAPHGPDGPLYPGTCRTLSADARERRLEREPHCWRLDVGKALAELPLPLGEGRGPLLRNGKGEDDSDSEEFPSASPFRACGAPSLSRGERELWWHDADAGRVRADPAAFGDVVLARKDAPASYHLAVTVDDAAQGVTHVVRGRDLFAATHVHRLLQALLGLPTPRYVHHTLLTDSAGHRLAKRHHAPTLAAMRAQGVDGAALAEMLRAGTLPVGFALAKD